MNKLKSLFKTNYKDIKILNSKIKECEDKIKEKDKIIKDQLFEIYNLDKEIVIKSDVLIIKSFYKQVILDEEDDYLIKRNIDFLKLKLKQRELSIKDLKRISITEDEELFITYEEKIYWLYRNMSEDNEFIKYKQLKS